MIRSWEFVGVEFAFFLKNFKNRKDLSTLACFPPCKGSVKNNIITLQILASIEQLNKIIQSFK